MHASDTCVGWQVGRKYESRAGTHPVYASSPSPSPSTTAAAAPRLPGFVLPDVGLLPLQLLHPGVPPAPHIRQRVLVAVVVAAGGGGGAAAENQAHLAVDARHQFEDLALKGFLNPRLQGAKPRRRSVLLLGTGATPG